LLCLASQFKKHVFAIKPFSLLRDHFRDVIFENAQFRSEKAFGSSISNRTYSWDTTLEAISKKWIRVQGKARGGEKAQHTR
jgi:hypothetical protein